MIATLSLTGKVGKCAIGVATLSPKQRIVEIGKCIPSLRTTEDIEGALSCSNLDPTVPIEFNLLNSVGFQKKLQKYLNLLAFTDDVLNPLDLISNRPSFGYVPPETLYNPSDDCAAALARTGPIGEQLSLLRASNPDGKFWTEVASKNLYPKWIKELLHHMGLLRGDLIAPPVPVITKDYKSSVDVQIQVNKAIGQGWKTIAGRKAREMGVLYSMHLSPNAFDSPDILRRTLIGLDTVLSSGDLNYWGVHLHYTDIRMVSSKGSRIDKAKDFTENVSKIAEKYQIFTTLADVGAIGPTFLDSGLAFTSYYPGMTPRKIFEGFGTTNEEQKFGKVLGLWKYNLHSREDVRQRNDQMDDTGLFIFNVPTNAQGNTAYKQFRVGFAKPYNISVMERLNIERQKEIQQNGNINPGCSHVGRSSDPLISPWS